MFKCSFCEAHTPHMVDKNIEAGWGIVDLYTQHTHIHMVHCPDHFHEFAEVLQREIATKKETT